MRIRPSASPTRSPYARAPLARRMQPVRKTCRFKCLVALLSCAGAAFLAAPQALAINKCAVDGKLLYSDLPCPPGKALGYAAPGDAAPDAASIEQARRRAARDKAELAAIERRQSADAAGQAQRAQRQARERGQRQQACAELARQRKWSEEDLRYASGRAIETMRRRARRDAEKYETACNGTRP